MKKPHAKSLTEADVKKAALAFPGIIEKPSHGRPAYFIGKKFFTRVRLEDQSVVLGVADIAQRDMMLELDPQTYFITEHYRNYPVLLVRLSHITYAELRTMLDRRFRMLAPKKLLALLPDGINSLNSAVKAPIKHKHRA